MNTPHPITHFAAEPRSQPVRDITWDRILFQPPALVNPRQVFDPLPFRTLSLPRRTRSSRTPFSR